MNNNWYIGQELVVIKKHPQNKILIGQEFVVRGLRLAPCKCNAIDIDIGISGDTTLAECHVCNCRWHDSDKTWWFGEHLFAPKQWLTEAAKAVEELKRTQLTEDRAFGNI